MHSLAWGEPTSRPQISEPHLLIIGQIGGGVGTDDMAVVQKIAAVGDGEALPRVLLDQEYADAGLLDARKRAEELGAQKRRQAEGGFIEHQDRRGRHHGAADRHHLALAATHGAHQLLASLLELRKQGEHALHVLRLGRPRAPGIGAENEVLLHGEVSENAATENMERVLALFPKLQERRKQLVRTMSGGERQMVAIGRAMMSAPTILMLDEPSLGLAPVLTLELFRTLARIKEAGMGIFLVEQNAKQSLAIADRGYLLDNGHIVGADSAEALRKDEKVKAAYLGE